MKTSRIVLFFETIKTQIRVTFDLKFDRYFDKLKTIFCSM